ncbi:hypothetical protein [Actinacidiphila sp. bgisy160]|uniref:hypothetical protein n=1 Tax=Actinacidiphila sp. bgisy160 TaxID=3413796 RepID=UPI003D72FAE5
MHRGAPCKWCTAGYPTIAENQMITMLDAIVEVDAPEVRTSGDDLRRRIADLA